MEGSTSRNEVIYVTHHEQQLVRAHLTQLIDALKRRQAIVGTALALEWPNEAYQPQKTEQDVWQLDGMLAGLDLAITTLAEWQPDHA